MRGGFIWSSINQMTRLTDTLNHMAPIKIGSLWHCGKD